MRRRSPDFWLGVGAILFLICLIAGAFAHSRYVTTEATYRAQLGHVVFTPHTDVRKNLNNAGAIADRWFKVQVGLLVLTLLATANVITQVVRRRNARGAAHKGATDN